MELGGAKALDLGAVEWLGNFPAVEFLVQDFFQELRGQVGLMVQEELALHIPELSTGELVVLGPVPKGGFFDQSAQGFLQKKELGFVIRVGDGQFEGPTAFEGRVHGFGVVGGGKKQALASFKHLKKHRDQGVFGVGHVGRGPTFPPGNEERVCFVEQNQRHSIHGILGGTNGRKQTLNTFFGFAVPFAANGAEVDQYQVSLVQTSKLSAQFGLPGTRRPTQHHHQTW